MNPKNVEIIGAERLALGTVQFGQNYGVANSRGQVDLDEASRMIDFARKVGINTLDTAIAYGSAEEVLGRLNVSDFCLISKLPAIDDTLVSVSDWVAKQVDASLSRLRISRLYGLMLHAPDDLLGNNSKELIKATVRLKEAGVVSRLGVSVYSPGQLNKIIDLFPVDMVQIPFNVFDRRFEDSGWLNRLAKNNIEIHSRSAFLQGLLLLPPGEVPSKFVRHSAQMASWYNWLESDHVDVRDPLTACIAHVASYGNINRIVVGADCLQHLQEIVGVTNKPPVRAPSALASSSLELINPALWN